MSKILIHGCRNEALKGRAFEARRKVHKRFAALAAEVHQGVEAVRMFRGRLALFVQLALSLALLSPAFAKNGVSIRTAHHGPREEQTADQLKKLIDSYDLTKYTFTRNVTIDRGAMNHAFPELTLNARFADVPDDLLSSYIHEQLHWYLRDHDMQQKAAINDLRRMYPNAPVGLPEGADSLYSTYGHLVDCYLEIEADRQLIGPERTLATIKNKGHYTWIYETILRDEAKIAAVVDEHHLRIK